MKLRPRYPFDAEPSYDDAVVNFLVLATTPDRKTWWLEAGAHGGCRFLAHFDGDKLYLAGRLHADTLVESGEYCTSVCRLLRRAADRLPVTALVVPRERPCSQWKVEYSTIGERVLASDGNPPAEWELLLPGFIPWQQPQSVRQPAPPDGWVHHNDGWYTRTERALPLPAPTWAPDAQAWDIAEGIYIAFADGSYRLVRRREYYSYRWVFCSAPIARQGDLLVYGETPQNAYHTYQGQMYSSVPECVCRDGENQIGTADLDRHHIDLGEERVTHPEHETLELPEGWQTIILAPGASRPFQRGGSAD
jgi:hypothetical protein